MKSWGMWKIFGVAIIFGWFFNPLFDHLSGWRVHNFVLPNGMVVRATGCQPEKWCRYSLRARFIRADAFREDQPNDR